MAKRGARIPGAFSEGLYCVSDPGKRKQQPYPCAMGTAHVQKCRVSIEGQQERKAWQIIQLKKRTGCNVVMHERTGSRYMLAKQDAYRPNDHACQRGH